MRVRSYIRRSKRGRRHRVKAHTKRDRKPKLKLTKVRKRREIILKIPPEYRDVEEKEFESKE